ncbi:hypothetical protein QUB63_07120 [Microcoleus sp. ARI1-B5]|uniref:hypothetical protein n=1 Tax=unclassified Microcoleus TaxID=2642155 RepID=UPI002FD44606
MKKGSRPDRHPTSLVYKKVPQCDRHNNLTDSQFFNIKPTSQPWLSSVIRNSSI